ncbi:sialidase-1 [Cyclobacterium lianum]|uniref:exo-alpha-sialidase n=1 Tax=Cyclobacterium lianum TaxID=388280 RepID=A0A1M7QJS4_9BACT|nr:exo-alpha-sialidase [Cyclobacterium lianum]SHN31513.1 sialidase-1 [Cyclobacterium lianum]
MRTIKFCLLVLVLAACGTGKDWPVADYISWEQVYVPVIAGKETPVGRLETEVNEAAILAAIGLELKAEIEVKEILLYKLSDERRQLLGSFNPSGGHWLFEKATDLSAGTQRFEITIVADQAADIRKKFDMQVAFVDLAGKKVKPAGQDSLLSYRLAKSIRDKGDNGVHTYRIPGLATSNAGTLLAVYDVRHDKGSDLQGDIDVGLSRSTNGGQSWEPMKIIMDMGEWAGLPQDQNGIGDPAILVDEETGTIWVAALWLHGKPNTAAWNSSGPGMSPEETGQLMLVKSEDDGESWSDPVNITAQMKDPSWQLFFNGPGKGITMKDGTLVFAAQYKDADKMPYSTIIYSKDRGTTWEVGTGAKSNTTEAQVVELADGSLMLNMRDNRGGSRSVAVTTDLGRNWTTHASSRSALIEPVCMASIINYTDEILLFSNPASTEAREDITLKASPDQGNTWPDHMQVLLDQGRSAGYSCLTLIDQDHVGIIYESSQAHLAFQVIAIQELIPE